MTPMILSRRAFIGGLIAAPAVVHAQSLMRNSNPWVLIQQVQVGEVYTPMLVRYWRQNGVIRSDGMTLWYGRREWNLARAQETRS